MKKSDTLKKKKWIKARRRARKIKKQQNYAYKTHKGTSPFYLSQNLVNKKQEEKEQNKILEKIKKEMLG